MEVNVDKVLKQPNDVFDFELSDKILYNDERIGFNKPINLKFSLKYNGKSITITGNINGEIDCNCDRCCDTFCYDLDIDFEEEILPEPSDDFDYIFEKGAISLDDIVINNVLLNLPMQLLCNQNCKGVCSRCYANLNTDKCKCL